jgi:hypothetical protein
MGNFRSSHIDEKILRRCGKAADFANGFKHAKSKIGNAAIPNPQLSPGYPIDRVLPE